MYTTEEIISYIKKYANDHYSDGGWDVIVECKTDVWQWFHGGAYKWPELVTGRAAK